jgi:hypothetical protein
MTKKTTRNQEFIQGTTYRKKGGPPGDFAAKHNKFNLPYVFTLTEWKIEKKDSR